MVQDIQIRTATLPDASAMNLVLQELIHAGKRNKSSDTDFVLKHYISHPSGIRCSVAQDESGQILGFQSLKLARAGNPYGTPVGWGIIGTHIKSTAARKGVGKMLFQSSKAAAQEAGLLQIEALIGVENAPALAFYESLGFVTYKQLSDAVGKSFSLL